MQISLRILIITLVTAFVLSSCDTSLDGNLDENLAPTTSLTVDNIEVEEGNRLSSRVTISWWGDDPDGYVEGYEYAITDTSEGSWQFTTRTDSVFILPISPGEEIEDVLFAVRAVDNEGKIDPDPASIEFPLRNSDPITELNTLELPPDTTYTIASFGWNIDDPDGLQTVRSTEIAINDTVNGWVEIPIETENQQEFFITVDISQEAGNEGSAEVFLGRNYRVSDIQLVGFQLDQPNTFYVRTKDLALAESEIKSYEWFLKRQTSKVLVLNDDASSSSNENLNFHLAQLRNIGISVDVIDISDGIGLENGVVPLSEAFSPVINPTMNQVLNQWDHIYHFSNSLNRNINYAEQLLEAFFDDGGTFFTNITTSRDASRTNDQLFNFLSISDYVSVNPQNAETGFIIENGAEVEAIQNGPNLIYKGNFNSRIWPFIPVSTSTALYRAELSKRLVFGQSEYDGPSTIAVLNPENNLLYFGLDLTDIEIETENDISELLEELLINRLGFTIEQ